jgi:pyruvate ferredoxin oxidoreductase beta subunit
MLNKVRRALSIGGPTFIHALDPCPKGWDYDPKYSHELGELAVETGIWPLYEIEQGKPALYGRSKQIAEGTFQRKPVGEYLRRQGRFAHFIDEDVAYFQSRIDAMWKQWLIPGVLPFQAP